MNYPNSRFEIGLASPDDAEALRAIYDSDDGFAGEIAVKYARDPDPYASLLADGDAVVVPVVREREGGRIVGMGACVTRTAWVNGEAVKVGYLTGLKGLPEYRRRVPLIPQVYAFLRDHSRDVRCYYTTILSENTLARRMLEKPRANMPAYRPVAEYVAHCFRGNIGGLHPLSGGTIAELVSLTRQQAQDDMSGRANLSAFGAPPGANDADVRVLRDAAGRGLAWCLLRDQRATKQYVVTSYAGRYQKLARLPVHWAGYPRLPRVGVPANYVSIGAIGGLSDGHIGRLLRAVGAEQYGRDFVMAGAVAGQRLASMLASRRVISYSSQLYTVHFDDDCLGLDGRQIELDVALL